MRVMMSGGGTGGHIYPALTIVRAIQQQVESCEVLSVGTKQGLEFDIIPKEGFKIKGKRLSNVWLFDRVPPTYHPTQKPLDLVSRMVGQCSDDGIVYDPFSGSGTTLVAAELSKRKWIGSELKEEYCKVVEKRIS